MAEAKAKREVVSVILELTKDEADCLRDVVGKAISGSPHTQYTDNIYHVLGEAGICGTEAEDMKGGIRFE